MLIWNLAMYPQSLCCKISIFLPEVLLFIWNLNSQANLCPSPVEIYQTLEVKGMCTGLAEFYMSWAWEIEKVGNYKRADAIYQKGLQNRAKPFDVLEDAHK